MSCGSGSSPFAGPECSRLRLSSPSLTPTLILAPPPQPLGRCFAHRGIVRSPIPSSHSCSPFLAQLGTCRPLQLVAPVPQINLHRGSRVPSGDLDARGAHGTWVWTQTGTLSAVPLGDPRSDSFVTGLPAGSVSGAGSGSGLGRSAIQRSSRAGRTLPVAIGTARGAKRRPPPAVTAPAAAAAAAATARIPALARVTPLLLPQHLRPDGENLTQVCSECFSRCAQLGVWTRTETRLLSRVCTFEPERTLPSTALLWDAPVWDRFGFSAGVG